MKTLLFTLSMPNVGSWNGQWTSANKCFARKRKVTDDLAKKIMDGAKQRPIYEGVFSPRLVGYEEPSVSFGYNFGDGWCASVKVTQTNAVNANKVCKKSSGFAGYDWMIDSILLKQEIVA